MRLLSAAIAILGLVSPLCGYATAEYETTDSISVPTKSILTTTYAVEVGEQRAFDTYLSPLSHSGAHFAISGEWGRGDMSAQSWHTTTAVRLSYSPMRCNPSRSAAMDDIGVSLTLKRMRPWAASGGVELSAGAGLLLDAGALYLPRNANNPVSARAYLGVTLEGMARYTLSIGSRQLSLIEQVSLPTIGCFFSPHYGQSYYEIYLGEDSGLARCGWWGNHFAISNLVAAELPVAGMRLRVGYRLGVQNSIASAIHRRITSHSLVIGISTDWINVTRRHE